MTQFNFITYSRSYTTPNIATSLDKFSWKFYVQNSIRFPTIFWEVDFKTQTVIKLMLY